MLGNRVVFLDVIGLSLRPLRRLGAAIGFSPTLCRVRGFLGAFIPVASVVAAISATSSAIAVTISAVTVPVLAVSAAAASVLLVAFPFWLVLDNWLIRE